MDRVDHGEMNIVLRKELSKFSESDLTGTKIPEMDSFEGRKRSFLTEGSSLPLLLNRFQNALKFINVDANMTHGNVRVDSVFLSQSGEWRLGGFEVLSSNKDDTSVLYVS